MTLVEVVASLALLGALLGTAVLAKGRLTRQWSMAKDRAEAVAALDAQLALWNQAVNAFDDEVAEGAEGSGWPQSGEGPMDAGRWWWRAEALEADTSQIMGLDVIRFTVFDPTNSPGHGDQPLALVDVLVYDNPVEETPSEPEAISENNRRSSSIDSTNLRHRGARP